MHINISTGLNIVKSQPPLYSSLDEASLYHQEKKFGFSSKLTKGINALISGLSNDEIKSLTLKLVAALKADFMQGDSHVC